ncbi:MAG TPA: hypothetical protein VFQ30_06735, partial [Ktedonobacteraceae bacterium]|nr:hypothetical protein [Ktedonobacteraceae bacterium]
MRKSLRWPVLLILAVLVLAALVPGFSLLHTGMSSKAHASGAASITLSSAASQPGTTIQASGQGFAPNDQINLYLNQVNGTLLASAAADSGGNLPATSITVPSQPTGQYTVVAMQAQSALSANTTLTIVPIFSLSQKKVQPGSLVGVKGAGFPFQDMIELFLDSTSGNSFTYGEDDYYGNISWSVNLPASSVVQGQHVIIAKSDTTGNILDFPVTFLPRAFPIVA